MSMLQQAIISDIQVERYNNNKFLPEKPLTANEVTEGMIAEMQEYEKWCSEFYKKDKAGE